MWIQVRSFDGKVSCRIDGLSKLTKVEELRQRLVEKFDASPDRQRLFYRGKQLEDGHTLFDYNVGLNEIVQIMVREPGPPEQTAASSSQEDQASVASTSKDSGVTSDSENEPRPQPDDDDDDQPHGGGLYKVGSVLDACDANSMGAWFEAEVVSAMMTEREGDEGNSSPKRTAENRPDTPLADTATTASTSSDSSQEELATPATFYKTTGDGFTYQIKYEGYDDEVSELSSRYLRPRARTQVNWEDLTVGDVVMVNYNSDEPKERGFWYDAVVVSKKSSRTSRTLMCNIFLGPDGDQLRDCQIVVTDEIYKIERPGEACSDPLPEGTTPTQRSKAVVCSHCRDAADAVCRHCNCYKCGIKKDDDKQLLCDECDQPFHIYCLSPPLDAIPDVDEWYCPLCKNDATEVVRAGEKLKESKKKSKMASASGKSTRDWGKGMACVGRTKMCTIVPANHFGAVPGVHVGTMWKFRVQASEAGVHRPHVAGIHGRENEGAYSIVLSGGYEDDVDEGDSFLYSGSGGRDLSGNKRTAEQSYDQKLAKMNLALALNCNASLNKKEGAEAKEWKGGKPVRVIRNCKLGKYSKYAPDQGNRYDGIYKVVKYWPEKGRSGFLVWRYKLRRDDKEPAPWTREGKKRVKALGLQLLYPEGYLEAQEDKEKEKKDPEGKKRKSSGAASGGGPLPKIQQLSITSSSASATAAGGDLTKELRARIKEDTGNAKCWAEIDQQVQSGKDLLKTVEDNFMCICCQELVYQPVTTPCLHNICQSCLKRSFRADVYSCPFCRHELGKSFSTMKINKTLQSILKELFPGYEAGR